MNITRLIETLLFPRIGGAGPGLPDPPTAKKAAPVKVEKASGRLVNAETMTYEWDIARARPANKPAELTDLEVEELNKRGLKKHDVERPYQTCPRAGAYNRRGGKRCRVRFQHGAKGLRRPIAL